ncbi:DUF6223 family protein [Planobispora siamensis]|uniref:Uncharacterized protein n=1 Tax=Planobispora siamensis TaxID=936338 RepID=A0A8J3SPZ3_9ACTN|nr:DUF6223 family protein [Planobispora siamensis]GIH96279.1 hypothetical protein Psi01_69090 [Planobispora siamensis]
MSVHRLLTAAATAPAALHVLLQPDPVGSYVLTSGRLWSLVAALPGLTGVIVGGLALARAAGRIGSGTGRRGAVVALAAGLLCAAVGGLVVAAAEGGPGTGYGIVGGYLDLVLGVIAMTLGALALARSRRRVTG